MRKNSVPSGCVWAYLVTTARTGMEQRMAQGKIPHTQRDIQLILMINWVELTPLITRKIKSSKKQNKVLSIQDSNISHATTKILHNKLVFH